MYALMAEKALESGMFDKVLNMFGKKKKKQNKEAVIKAIAEFDALKEEMAETKEMMKVIMKEVGIKSIVKKFVVEKDK